MKDKSMGTIGLEIAANQKTLIKDWRGSVTEEDIDDAYFQTTISVFPDIEKDAIVDRRIERHNANIKAEGKLREEKLVEEEEKKRQSEDAKLGEQKA